MTSESVREIREVRKLLDQTIAKLRSAIRTYGKSSNPQIVAMKERAEARLDMAELLADALAGDLVRLRIYAEK